MQLVDTTLCFGNWKYSPGTGTLWRMPNGTNSTAAPAEPAAPESHTIVLEPRLHSLLNYFLQQPEKVHSKSSLLDAIWGDAEGTDAALMRAIGMLRKALEDSSKPATYIETLSKRGYRWVAPVHQMPQVAQERVALKLKTPSASNYVQTEAEQRVSGTDTAELSPTQISRREKQRRLGLLSAFFICAVVALVVSLLLFFGKTNFMPAFNRQIIVSAMAGQEQKPLLSPDQSTLFYQQKTSEARWRWIAHHLGSHRKQFQPQLFDNLSAGQWFEQQLVFQGELHGRCDIYRLTPDAPEQTAQAWLPCHQLIGQGMAARGKDLIWLDMNTNGASQLWRYSAGKAELQQTFAASYRRPVAVLLVNEIAWVLLQQDELNTSLFSFDLSSATLQKVADFPYAFHTLSNWDGRRLLLSSPSGSYLFSIADLQLAALQLASGAYVDQQRVEDRLLATQIPRDAADLLPLQPSAGGRSSTLLSASPWLSSNKTDQMLSWHGDQAALVSERSGLPQIWWFDGHKISQLTKFTQWRQITQLLWSDAELYAVIEQQLYLVSLQDGSISPALLQDRQLRHFAVCHRQWYWAEFSHQQWQLKTLNQQQHPVELLTDIIDVRCAPDQSLLVLKLDGSLHRFWPETSTLQSLPWQLKWRQMSMNSWTTTSEGLYWFDPTGQLWLSRWQQSTRKAVASPGLLLVTGIYGELEQEQLFLQLARDTETDVVWLQPQQFQ